MVLSKIELENKCDKRIKYKISLLKKELDRLLMEEWSYKTGKEIIIYFKDISRHTLNFIKGWDSREDDCFSTYICSSATVYFTDEVIKDIIREYTENGFDISFNDNFFWGKYFIFER